MKNVRALPRKSKMFVFIQTESKIFFGFEVLVTFAPLVSEKLFGLELSLMDLFTVFQMPPSHLTLPPRRMLRTQAWTPPPISLWDPPLSRRAGQLGPQCRRARSRHKPWGDRWTLSSLLFTNPPLDAVQTHRTIMPGLPLPHALPVAPQRRTPPLGLLPFLSSPHLRWSLLCGTASTFPLRTPS